MPLLERRLDAVGANVTHIAAGEDGTSTMITATVRNLPEPTVLDELGAVGAVSLHTPSLEQPLYGGTVADVQQQTDPTTQDTILALTVTPDTASALAAATSTPDTRVELQVDGAVISSFRTPEPLRESVYLMMGGASADAAAQRTLLVTELIRSGPLRSRWTPEHD